jgi:hypothetical protein
MAVDLFDNWLDPIETEVRARARQFIEELIRGELDTALARPRLSELSDFRTSRYYVCDQSDTARPPAREVDDSSRP